MDFLWSVFSSSSSSSENASSSESLANYSQRLKSLGLLREKLLKDTQEMKDAADKFFRCWEKWENSLVLSVNEAHKVSSEQLEQAKIFQETQATLRSYCFDVMSETIDPWITKMKALHIKYDATETSKKNALKSLGVKNSLVKKIESSGSDSRTQKNELINRELELASEKLENNKNLFIRTLKDLEMTSKTELSNFIVSLLQKQHSLFKSSHNFMESTFDLRQNIESAISESTPKSDAFKRRSVIAIDASQLDIDPNFIHDSEALKNSASQLMDPLLGKPPEQIPSEFWKVICSNVIELRGPLFYLGTLYISSYRMVFVAYNKKNIAMNSDLSTIHDIPFGLIDRLDTISGKDDLLFIGTKDLRAYYFSFSHSSVTKSRVLEFYASLKAEMSEFAFQYKQCYSINGWKIYNQEREFARLGLFNNILYRKTDLNRDYDLSPSYPSDFLYVPAKISDDIIKRAALFRSKSRFISICWKNPKGSELIARCSQPLAGITRGRNWFDEEIVKEISEVTKLMTAHEHLSMTDPEVENTSPMMTPKDAEISETYFDDTKSNFSDQSPTLVSPISLGRSRVMIFDARPLANAFGNAVIGGGWESTDYYKDVDFRFGDIPNIHAVRESFHGYRDLWLIKLDSKPPQTNDSLEWATRYRDLLKDLRSNRGLGSWFSHLSKILSASSDIATWIAEKQKSAIIHCSDGWDRASQLTSTTQLLLDPYYRTITGFIVLIEKEWVSYGYKFAQRFGFGSFKSDSSDKQRSPVFIQWLDCVFQLLYQFPREFEFTPQFLVEIADLLYSARFGTFLENCEKNRKQIEGETISLWSHALENKENFTNSEWNNEIQTVPLIPATATEDLQIWLHFYNRWDYALIRSQVKAEDILLHLT